MKKDPNCTICDEAGRIETKGGAFFDCPACRRYDEEGRQILRESEAVVIRELGPKDVLVLKPRRRMSTEACEELRALAAKMFCHVKDQVAILHEVELEVVKKTK